MRYLQDLFHHLGVWVSALDTTSTSDGNPIRTYKSETELLVPHRTCSLARTTPLSAELAAKVGPTKVANVMSKGSGYRPSKYREVSWPFHRVIATIIFPDCYCSGLRAREA